jgi:hypothetical protein
MPLRAWLGIVLLLVTSNTKAEASPILYQQVVTGAGDTGCVRHAPGSGRRSTSSRSVLGPILSNLRTWRLHDPRHACF